MRPRRLRRRSASPWCQSRQDGRLQVSEAAWPALPAFVSLNCRAQVRAEAVTALASGAVPFPGFMFESPAKT